jgi:siderophore synthetase component
MPRFLKTAFAFKIFQGYLDGFRRGITDFFSQVHNCDETSPLHITKETILKTMEAYWLLSAKVIVFKKNSGFNMRCKGNVVDSLSSKRLNENRSEPQQLSNEPKWEKYQI